jgi:hypothetical protein
MRTRIRVLYPSAAVFSLVKLFQQRQSSHLSQDGLMFKMEEMFQSLADSCELRSSFCLEPSIVDPSRSCNSSVQTIITQV